MELTLNPPMRIIPLKVLRVSLLFLCLLFAFPLLISLADGPVISAAPTPSYSATEQALLTRINEIRAEHGLASVQWNNALGQAADTHVADMSGNLNRSHYGTDGSNYRQRVARTGYVATDVNEAIGWGYNMDRQINWWMNSPVHRGIILSSRYTEIGIGHIGGGRYGNWWVMNFANHQ